MPTFTPTTQTLLAYSTGGTPDGPYTASPSPATGTQQTVVLSVTCNVCSVKGGTLGCSGGAYLWYSVSQSRYG